MDTCGACGQQQLDWMKFCPACGAGRQPGFIGRAATKQAAVDVRLSAPWYLALVGLVSLLFGAGLAALNWMLIIPSIQQLQSLGGGPGSTTTLWISIWSLTAVGAICALAGIGLLFGQRWGRWLAFVYCGASFVGLLIAACAAAVSANLLEVELAEHGGAPLGSPAQIRFVAGVPALAPVYGLFLVIVLNLRRVREWAAGRPRELRLAAAGNPPPAAVAELSLLALCSFILSLVPFLLLTQVAALIVGIVALHRIKRSAGRLMGRGFAIAGVSIASVILLFMGTVVGAALAYACLEHSHERSPQPELNVRHSLAVPDGDHITQLAFSPDGSKLLCRAQEAGLSMWDTDTGEKLWQIPAAGGDCRFTPGGDEVAAVASGNPPELVFWESQTGTEARTIPLVGEPPPLTATAFCWGSPNRLGACAANEVYIWQADTGELVANWQTPAREDGWDNQNQALAFTPDGQQVLVSSSTGFFLCDALDGQVVRQIPAEYNSVGRLFVMADGQFAVAGGTRLWGATTIRIIDLATGVITPFDKHRWSSWAQDLTPDGKLAVSGGRNAVDADYLVINGQREDYGHEIILWKPQSQEVLATSYSPKSSVEAIGISADGKQVAAAESGTITLFELQQAPDAVR